MVLGTLAACLARHSAYRKINIVPDGNTSSILLCHLKESIFQRATCQPRFPRATSCGGGDSYIRNVDCAFGYCSPTTEPMYGPIISFRHHLLTSCIKARLAVWKQSRKQQCRVVENPSKAHQKHHKENAENHKLLRRFKLVEQSGTTRLPRLALH